MQLINKLLNLCLFFINMNKVQTILSVNWLLINLMHLNFFIKIIERVNKLGFKPTNAL